MLGRDAGLGVLEEAMRTALAAAGARLLEAVLGGDDDGYAGPRAKCGAGQSEVAAGAAGWADAGALRIAAVAPSPSPFRR